jgi:saccharopine dehydrogenase-like NADP-dependent oxidoreductase
MFDKIVILGLGGIGTLVASMLRDLGADVLGADVRKDLSLPDGIRFTAADLADPAQLRSTLTGQDAVVSCLPYQQTLAAAEAAHDIGLHYFDPTEDVATRKAIQKLAAGAQHAMIPQNGLAPGFIGILGAAVARRFDAEGLRHIRLRVGALPQHPIGQLGYAGNWSLHGLVHEYIAECEAIVDGAVRAIPPLRNAEKLRIFGAEFEAFSTSGGLGTLPDTFAGRVESLNYKSIRYPGHLGCMRLLLEELRFRNDPDALVERLADALPPDEQDRVLIHASVQGLVDGQMQTQEVVADYWPIEIAGRMRTAITWTTSASIVAIVEMVATGLLPQRGFVRQEDVPLEGFLGTSTGQLFAQHHPTLEQWHAGS